MRIIFLSVVAIFLFAGCKKAATVDTSQCLQLGSANQTGSSGFRATASFTGREYVTGLIIDGQTLPFVIDTGSSNLVVQGDVNLCPTCTGDPSTRFTPNGAKATGQTANIGYGSGSGTVAVYSDNVGICGTQVSLNFDVLTVSNGLPNILGLAYPAQALETTNPTFLQQLHAADPNLDNIFSILLCGTKSGSGILIGTASPKVNATIQYTPIIEQSYYVVNAKKLAVAGAPAVNAIPFPTSGAKVIVDSGTTFAYITTAMQNLLVAQIQDLVLQSTTKSIVDDFFNTTSASDPNYALSDTALGGVVNWPTISLTLLGVAGGADISVKLLPQNYLKNVGSGLYAFGFRGGATSLIVLGQTVMENFLVVFDRANTQIGFQDNTGLCT